MVRATSNPLISFNFFGVENLSGAADNEDTFIFHEGGDLAGVLDGGSGGFDTLVLDGGSYDTVIYSATGPDAGTISRDGQMITYAGLEPIDDNQDAANREIGLTDADNRATLSQAGDKLTISDDDGTPGTFESITFSKPTESLTIRGAAGTDTITILSIDTAFIGDLTIEAENIVVPPTAVIATAGNVNLNATAEDSSPVTKESDVVARSASVTLNGKINAIGNITVTAEAVRNIKIESSLASVAAASTTTAKIAVGSSAVLTGVNLQFTAKTRGTVSTANLSGLLSAKNDFTDTATVSITGPVSNSASAQINADMLILSARRSTKYSTKGRDAVNDISGNTSATIVGSTVAADSGGVSITASNNVELTAHSPEMVINLDDVGAPLTVEVSSARNYLSGDTQASITNSAVTVSNNGDLNVTAKKNVQISAQAETDSVVWSSPSSSFPYALTLNGTYTSNILLGNTAAFYFRWKCLHDRNRGCGAVGSR